jgi:hypothetical protein
MPIIEVRNVPTSMWVFSQNLCLYVTNNTWKLVVFRSKIGILAKIWTRISSMNIGSWTDSLILAKITTRKPITCSFWRCSVLTLFHHIWWVMRAQHSESLDFAYPGNDENTIAKQVLVRFTSWKVAITSEWVSLWLCDAWNHQNRTSRGWVMLICTKSDVKAT